MNIQQRNPGSPDEFLRWNERREGKREFVNGRIVELMINVTRNHVRLATRLVVALSRRLDTAAYDVGSADFAVRTPNGIRYPDVLVDRITPEASSLDLAATHPVLLAEILSPSSYGRDFIEKVSDYGGMESVLYSLIVSQEEPRAWLCGREEGRWNSPREFAGEDVIPLPALGVELTLGEIYAGIAPRSAS